MPTEEAHSTRIDILKRLPKRLAYLLRYGAVKEGLTVDDNGFVPLDELLQTPLVCVYTRDEVLHEIESSISYRTTQRFESRKKDGQIEVRARYLRRFEENPMHSGTNVKTLLECAMSHVINNIDDYDLENFPDENIIRRMFHRLKRQKKLTVKALASLLVPTITRLDMEGVYLTNNTLRILYKQCPNITQISFKGCGYIITDNVLSQIVKNLPGIEKLNLCQCHHLTAQCLSILAKRLPRLSVLHAASIPALTSKSVLDFFNKAKTLTFLDIYYMVYTIDEYQQLTKTATSIGVNLILRKPKGLREEETNDSDQVQANPDVDSWEPYSDGEDEDDDNDDDGGGDMI